MKSLATGRVRYAVWVLSAGLIVVASAAEGATLTVCDIGCEFSSVQDAVDAAADDDVVSVLPGVYVENVRIEGKRLVLSAALGPDVTVLDGGGIGPVVRIGELSDAVVEGFTITHAGGGSTFVENGYGIVVTPFTTARATIRGNLMVNNHPRAGIGIIRGDDLEVEVTGNRLIGNTRGLQLELSSSTATQGYVKVTNNVMAFNDAHPDEPAGAGLSLIGCCAFGPPGDFTVDVVNNTVFGNHAQYGGGLAANISNLALENNIFFGNTAGSGPDLYLVQAALTGIVAFNIIGDGQFPESNSSADPLLVDPAALNFHLAAASPAVDAGNNDAGNIPATDFESDRRIIDGNGDGVRIVDVGADELRVWPAGHAVPIVDPEFSSWSPADL